MGLLCWWPFFVCDVLVLFRFFAMVDLITKFAMEAVTITGLLPASTSSGPWGLSASLEAGAYYYPPGSSVPSAVSESELNARVMRVFPSLTLENAYSKMPTVLSGMPISSNPGPVCETFHSIRAQPVRIDHHTDGVTSARAAGVRLSKVNSLMKGTDGSRLRSCQSLHHVVSLGRPADSALFSRVPMCRSCYDLYRFKRSRRSGSRYVPLKRLFRDERLKADLVKLARLEVFVGWVIVCASERRDCAVNVHEVSVRELEEIGVLVSLYLFAFNYPRRYSSLRLLDPSDPERAVRRISERQSSRIRGNKISSRVWWRTTSERGVLSRSGFPSSLSGSCTAASVKQCKIGQHSIVWTDHYFYSMDLVSLSASLRGVHPLVTVTLSVVCCGPSGEVSPGFPPVLNVSNHGADVTVPDSENVSFAFVWRSVLRARDAVFGRRQTSGCVDMVAVPLIRLVVRGSPLHPASPRRKFSALTVVKASSPGGGSLIPEKTNSFMVWALGAAALSGGVTAESSAYAVASMFPFSEADISRLRDRVDSCGPWPELPGLDDSDLCSVIAGVFERE